MSPTLSFKLEPIRDVIGEILDLAKDWWLESKFYKDSKMELVHDEEFYEKYIYPSTQCLVGRDKDGKMGAHYCFTIMPYMFNTSYRVAHEFVWHIRKDLQGTSAYSELLASVEAELISQGVDLYNLAVPGDLRHSRVCESLERRGFHLQDLLYIKYLR